MATREVDGCAKLWKQAWAEVRNFSVRPLGPQPAERRAFGLDKGGCMQYKGDHHQPSSAHTSRGSQGPLGIPPGHPQEPARNRGSRPLQSSSTNFALVLIPALPVRVLRTCHTWDPRMEGTGESKLTERTPSWKVQQLGRRQVLLVPMSSCFAQCPTGPHPGLHSEQRSARHAPRRRPAMLGTGGVMNGNTRWRLLRGKPPIYMYIGMLMKSVPSLCASPHGV